MPQKKLPPSIISPLTGNTLTLKHDPRISDVSSLLLLTEVQDSVEYLDTVVVYYNPASSEPREVFYVPIEPFEEEGFLEDEKIDVNDKDKLVNLEVIDEIETDYMNRLLDLELSQIEIATIDRKLKALRKVRFELRKFRIQN